MRVDSSSDRTPTRPPTVSMRRERRAYVMLVVIAVSVMVITALSTLAKVSLRRGLEAADAQRSLQQRWGELTLQRALLTRAPEVFEQREQLAAKLTPGVPPPPTIRTALTLGGVTFDILLGDEDAKLNLNSLYHQVGPQRTEAIVADMLSPGARGAFRMLPAAPPMNLDRQAQRMSVASEGESEDDDPRLAPDALRSWGEVFDLSALEAQLGSDVALPNVTTGMTCWGNGQLNFSRASDQAILAIASTVVQDGGARRLLMRYRRSPTATLAVLLQSEVSSQRNRDNLARLLSETSSNFSVWIDASSRGRGSLRTFTVTQRDDEGVTRQIRFAH